MGGTANAKRARTRKKMKAASNKAKMVAQLANISPSNSNSGGGTTGNSPHNSPEPVTPPNSMRRMGNTNALNDGDPNTNESTPSSGERMGFGKHRRSVSENILSFAGREISSPFINGDLFQQEVIVRSKFTRKPMEPLHRLKANLVRRIGFTRSSLAFEGGNGGLVRGIDGTTVENNAEVFDATIKAPVVRKQYTVTAKVRKSDGFWGKLGLQINPDDFSYRPSGWATSYINWTFRSGFAIVFFTFLLFFFVFVLIFGFFFYLLGKKSPQCIVVAGEEFGRNAGTEMWDGFALSWTTFTTVGYGAVYTATGNDFTQQWNCALIAFLCTAESFLGLLYAGICTAIMFGKIGRIQSHAQVTFSDAMCIEYGKIESAPDKTTSAAAATTRSVMGSLSHMSAISAGSGLVTSDRSLESHEPVDLTLGGETKFVERLPMMEDHMGQLGIANMTIDEETEDCDEEDSNNDDDDDDDDDDEYDDDDDDDDDYNISFDDHEDTAKHANLYPSMADLDNVTVHPPQATETYGSRKKILCPVLRFQLVNELANSPGGEIIDANLNFMVRKEKESWPYEPIARFLRVELEEASHPFFNRVWHGRHKLDKNSPLVSIVARQMIGKNDGYWPEELNNPASIREHLRFSSVIITMTGISNVSAESVQIAKRYYHHDVIIGYNFAPLLYKSEGSESLKVDMSLINDVVEQEYMVPEYLTDNELVRPSLRSNANDHKGWNFSNLSTTSLRSSSTSTTTSTAPNKQKSVKTLT